MEEFDVNGAYSRLVADGKIDKTKVSGDDFIREYNTNDNYRKHVEDYMGTISTPVAKETPTVAETPETNVTDLGTQPEAEEAPVVAETPEESVTDLAVKPKTEEAPTVNETPEANVTDLKVQPEAKEDDSAEAFNLEPMVQKLNDESDAIMLDNADREMKLREPAEDSPEQNREVILFGREDYEPLTNYFREDEYFKKYWPHNDPKSGKSKKTYGGIALNTVIGVGENNDFMVNGQVYGLSPEEEANQAYAFRLIDDESGLIPTATGMHIWHRYGENDELPRMFRERVAKVTELLHNNADKETIDREVLQARKDLYGLIVKPYLMADGDVRIGDKQTTLSSVAKECIDSALENRDGNAGRVGQLYLEAIRKCMYSVDYTREYSHAIDKMNMTLRDHLYNEYAGRGKGRYKDMTDFEKTAESAYSYIEYVDALRKSGVSAEQINSVLKSTGSKSVFDSRARKDMDNLFALKNYEKMRQALSSAKEDKALSEYSNALLGNPDLSTYFLSDKLKSHGYSFGYEDDGISASFQGHNIGVILSYDKIADLAKKRIKVDSYIKSKDVASALEKLQSSEDRISKGEAAVTILSAIKADYNDALWTKRNIDEAANAFADARERNSEGVMASVWRVASAPFTHPFSGISETLTKGYDRDDLDSASADAVRLAGMEKGRSVFGFQHRQAISMRLSAEHLAGNELSEQAQTTQVFEQAAGGLGEIALDMWVGAKGLGLAAKLFTGFRKGARLANRFRKFGSSLMKDGSMGEAPALIGKHIVKSTGNAIAMPFAMPSTYGKDSDVTYVDNLGNIQVEKNNNSFGKRWLENVAMLMSFEGAGKFLNPKLWVRANIEKELADVSFAKALDRTLRGQVGKGIFERSADAVFTGIPMMLHQSLEAAINGEDISKVWTADNTKAAIIAGIAMHYANPKIQLEALTGGRSAVAIPGRIASNISFNRIYDSLDARGRKLAREVREAADDKEINAIISAEVERIKAIGDEEMRNKALAEASKALSYGLQEKGVELALAIEKAGAEAPEVKTESPEPNPANSPKEEAPEIKAEEEKPASEVDGEKPAAEVEESKGEESPSLLSRIRTNLRNVFRKKEDEAPQTKEEETPQTKEEAPATEVKADVEPERKAEAESEPERKIEAEPERKVGVEAERKDEAEAEPERKGGFADGDIILTTETDAEGKERSQQWRVSEGADGELWAVPEGEATDLRRVRLSAIAHRATPGKAVASDKTPLTDKQSQEQKSAISHTEPNFLEVPPEVRREQGYVYHNGTLVQRQTPEDVGMILGNGVEISFGNDRPAVNAQYALVPIDKVQAAHVDEHRNPLHFIPEAQPKERDVNDGASVEERTKMKNAFRPHAITIGDMSAFSGAPIVNERGEAIQGNNRIALLKEILHMGDARAINAAGKYYSYLREHATELGIDPKDIRKGMMLVRMARVSDAQAIELGNIPDSNMTTGGERKLPSQQIVSRLSIGDKFNDFVAVLFGGNSADMSISDAIDKNGQNALEWLCRQGYISNAEYQSAMVSHRGKQRLTDDASDTMTRIVNDVVCQGATPRQVEIWKEQSPQRKSMMLSVLAKLISLPEERRKPVYDKVFRALELISEVEAIDEQFPKGGVPDTFRAIFQRMGQMSMLGESDRLRGFSVEDALLAAVIKGERNAQSLRLRQFMGRVVEHTDKTTVRDGELDFGPRKEMSVEEAIRSAAREQYGISDESIAEAQMLIEKKEAQYADGRLSVGQDGVRDEAVYEMTRDLVSDAVGKDNVIEVSDAEAREMIGTREDAVLMGSRTKTKMKAIEDYYADKDLDENARAVVDVFSGKRDNVTIEVERPEGKKRVVMRQGKEPKAGTKHSLFRHFETRSNYYSTEEIALIPEIIANGRRSVSGREISYDYTAEDGNRLRVTTELKGEREIFTNFIAKRKPRTSEAQVPLGDTQPSAGATNAEVSGAKVGKKFQIGKSEGKEASAELTKEELRALDAQYMEAVERGDMEFAQQMVDEAARRAGYSADSDYQGTSAFNGAAPFNGYGWSKEERRKHWDEGDFEGDWTLGDQIDGMDNGDLEFRIFDPRGLRSLTDAGRESAQALREAYRNPERKIKVYRSVPSDVKEGSLRDGDWVTPSRTYAKENAAVHGWGRKYRIIEEEVDVDELWWDGNDINEWGYDSGSNMAYRNTKNNRKSLDAVTYDDNGAVIPLSKRFNLHKNDTRYLKTPEGVVYGWTQGGKVYLNRDAMNPETPLHEYTHLWDEMVRKKNPALWSRGKELLKRTSLWQEVLDDANYADIRADEDAVASEVHSRLTGREGAKLLAGILADGRIKPMERAGVLSQVKAWITDMYREMRGTFEKWSGHDLSKLSVEDFTRMTLRDLADGVNPRDYIVPESDARFSIRAEGAPRKTKTAYAAFVMLRDKDGKLSFHPKMIKGDSAGTPVRTWLNADTGIISRDRNGNIITNTLGRISVQNNSIDKNGKAPKSTPLAWRPGKHLAPYPNASQFKLGNGKMQGNIIFAEVEYAADKDYQTQAWEYGINANGKYVHSQAGLPYIPKDGFYMYRTNARPDVPAMIITGAYKVNRFLTDAEAKKLNQAAGGEWIERDGATIDKAFLRENGISDEQLEARKSEFDTSKLEGPRDESAKVMELEAYTPRAINFDDVNLKAAAKENGQNLDDYRNNYKTPQERGWRRENALNDGTLERPGANVGGGIEAEAVESMGVRMGVRVVVDRTLGSRGAYNPKTGEVRVNPDAHKSMADLERTMTHEIVGHKGIHSLLGKSFDKVCERVSHLIDGEADKALGSLFRNWGTMSRRERGAEYMAWLAEKGGENTNPGKWQRVCGYVRVAMRRMGFGFEVTDADVRYMLYVSAKRATKAGRSLSAVVESYSPAEREYIERLRTEAELSHDPMQDVMRMGEGDGWLQRPQSQFAPDGNGDMMMRTNIGVSPRELTEWGELMAQSSAFGRANTYGAGEKFTVNVVDSAYPIARFMAGVLGLKNAEQARRVNGYNNPYMNRERSASRSMTEYRRAMDIYKPRLADARVDAIGASLRVWPELRRKRGAAEMLWHVYISAKGGLERQEYHMSQPDAEARDYAGLTSMNKALMEIKANKRSDVKNAFELWARSKTGKKVKYEKASLELIEEFAKSKVGSLKDFCAEYEEWCMQGSRASKFWGIVSEMTGRMRRQMYESDLISSDSYHRLQFGGTLAEIYRDATGRVLDKATASQYPNLESMVKAGLIDEAYAMGLRPLYTHYLPLKGEYSELSLVESSTGALEAAAEATNRHKGDMPSANIHSVEGHQNLTIDPVSVLLYDYMRSMSASFENEWRKQLADMVAAHEDSLGQGDEPMAVVCRNMLNIDAKLGKLLPGKGRDRKKTYEDNAVYVRIGGKSCAILFADQNVGRAINAPFVKPGPVGTLVRSMTRGFSTLFTSLNATFWGSNLLRDSHALVEYNFVKGLGGAKSGTLSTIARLAGVELKDAGALLRQAWGELGGKPAKDPYVREFFDHGARTAANEQSSRDEIEGIMKSMFKTDKDGNPISLKNENVVSATMQLIERIGEMTELRTRLLTYVAWRRKGASVEEAVHHSKEVSVNFDRRGRWARQWGLFQPFLNAAIQANRRDWELAKGEPLRFLMYRGIHFASRTMIALGIGYIAYNAFSDDENQLSFEQYLERYYAINNYTRNSYHLLPMGDLGTISFADALDNRPWNMLGDVLLREYFLSNGMLKGRTEDESPDKILVDMGTALFEKLGVEPASRAYRWAVTGTGSIPGILFGGHPALAPMFNIIENRNHMGAAIQKEDYSHDPSLPEYTRDREAIKGTLSHKIAVWLNNATAINGKKVGIINLGGGQIAELGGSFGTISDITGTVAGAINLARGGDVRDFARKMIVLKGFYRQPIEKYYESGKKSDWFKLRRKADENLNAFKNMLKHKYEGSVETDLGALLVEADAQGLYYIEGLSTLERMAKESGQPWVNEMVSELKDGTYRNHHYAEGDLKYAIELLGRAAYLDAIAPQKVADVTENTETAWALSRLGRKVQTALGKITKLTPEDGYTAEEAKKEFADALRDITETSALSAVESELNILKQ